MDTHTAHIMERARRIIATTALGTIDVKGNACGTAWDAYDCGVFAAAACDMHTCDVEAAMLVTWLLARKLYPSPDLFESEAGVILAPVVMGEYL